jgi:hypothetical protein
MSEYFELSMPTEYESGLVCCAMHSGAVREKSFPRADIVLEAPNMLMPDAVQKEAHIDNPMIWSSDLVSV